MAANSGDQGLFIPALSLSEAKERIQSLTGGERVSTRGEKRAIVALAQSVGLDVNVSRTNVDLARAIADCLSVEWERRFEDRSKINLAGLNALLEGASEAKRRGALQKLQDERPIALRESEWIEFIPSKSKIEAVNRLSFLTGSGPESLGPGSKERKSVLTNLAERLAPEIDTKQPKTGLAAALAKFFGVSWTSTCASTGETISLEGLNTILAGAERHLGVLGQTPILHPPGATSEAQALVNALRDGWQPKRQQDGEKRVIWDGVECVNWLRVQGTNQQCQKEWQGFYWEAMGLEILNRSFRGRSEPLRQRYLNTTFDYALNYLWDFKAKTDSLRLADGSLRRQSPQTQLNASDASAAAIAEQGLGFIVVRGIAMLDEDSEVRIFQRSLGCGPSAPSNSGLSRPMKRNFEPFSIDAFYIPNSQALDLAILNGVLKIRQQGRQSPRLAGGSGAPRGSKLELNLHRALQSEWHCAMACWP